MSDKRFIIEVNANRDVRILDMELGGLDIGQYNVCKLLNNLYEENKDLKMEIEDLKDIIKIVEEDYEDLDYGLDSDDLSY